MAAALARAQARTAIEELLKHADFVTLHVPLLPVTRDLIDAQAARGDEAGRGAAQLRARRASSTRTPCSPRCARQRLKYYLCDFPSAALLGEPGVVALPHLGASTAEAEENCAVMVVDQVREYLEHGTIANAVNFPSVEMPRESPYRVAIANANVPEHARPDLARRWRTPGSTSTTWSTSRAARWRTRWSTSTARSTTRGRAIAAIDGVLSVRAIPAEASA